MWESTFADAIIEAKTVVDAQINYTVPKWKSTFKIGGANLGGKEYLTALYRCLTEPKQRKNRLTRKPI